MTTYLRKLLILAGSALLLGGCDLIAMFDEQGKLDARREAEGRAIGSACRHAGRAIEDCYERSPKVSKAAIFAGWRDMDGYMRENNIQIVSPGTPEPAAKAAEDEAEKPKTAEAAPAEEAPKATAPGKSPAEQKKAAAAPPAMKQGSAATPVGKNSKHVA